MAFHNPPQIESGLWQWSTKCSLLYATYVLRLNKQSQSLNKFSLLLQCTYILCVHPENTVYTGVWEQCLLAAHRKETASKRVKKKTPKGIIIKKKQQCVRWTAHYERLHRVTMTTCRYAAGISSPSTSSQHKMKPDQSATTVSTTEQCYMWYQINKTTLRLPISNHIKQNKLSCN